MANDISQLIQNPEALGLERQRQMAQMLLKQGMTMPQGQMIGDRYVPTNPMQYVGNLFNTYAGQKGLESVDQQELAMALRQKEKAKNEVNDILTLAQGRPELPSQELAGPANPYDAFKKPTIDYPAIEPNNQAALAKALTGDTAPAQSLVAPLMQNLLPKKTDKLIEYDTYKKEGGKKTFSDWSKEITPEQQARLDIERQRLGLEGARFGLEKQKVEQELINGKPLSEFQGKATNYGVQMAGSMQEMAAVEKSGFNPVSSKNQALLAISGTGLGNMVVPAEAQRYKQAMDNFTENFIRFKSGANVPMHEIEKDLKNMMPQPGDKQDKIEQKQRARERALEGMSISAGPGIKYINQAYQSQAPGMLNKPQATQPSAPTSAPTPGVVQDGYVFLGGDPSQPTSWRKQ
jgi:hypothetical protein